MGSAPPRLASLPLLVLALVAAPGAAFAADVPPVAIVERTAPLSAPAPRRESQRLQVATALDITQNGMGLQAGLRYSHFEASVGASYALFGLRTFVGVKAFLFPDLALAPYAYGRVGSWHESALFQDPEQGGTSLAVGGGLDIRVTRHVFGFAELGYSREADHIASDSGKPFTQTGKDLRLGVGFRF